jgi:predicted PurR-regulated permease PerM
VALSWITQVRERARGRLAAAREASDLDEAARDAGDQVLVVEPSEPTVDDGVPLALRVAAAWAWRLVVLLGAAYLLLRVIGILRVVVIPVIVALLLAALLEPAASRLRRQGVGRSLSAAIVLVTGLVVVFGTLSLVIQTFIGQFDSLAAQVDDGIAEVQTWLSQGPLHLSQSQLDDLFDQARETLTNNQDSLTAGALSTATTVGEVVTGFFLVLFTLFFFLRDGGAIWRFITRLLPRPAEAPVYQAGRYSWRTLSSYVRATILVAFVDAVGIGIGLVVLRVPLALPLAALVFLGAFIPVVGATLSGAVAVLVALVAQGPVSALLVLGVVIAVQQLEGHVLQPLIMGRAVSLHPLAVILAIAAGLVLAGIVGGLVAVPLLAVLNTAVRYLASYDRGRLARDDKPPGTRPVDDDAAEVEAVRDAQAGEAGASVGTGATTMP